MKKSHKGFWIFYAIWIILNVTLLIFAINDTFGEFNKTTSEFWPFTVGNPRYYDFFELAVYLIIPLIIFGVYYFVHVKEHSKVKENP